MKLFELGHDMFLKEENTVIALEANRTLRKLVGENTDLSLIFNKDVVNKCQRMIESARKSYYDVAEKDLLKLEALVNYSVSSKAGKEASLEEVASLASNIRGHAEAFGISLISKIGDYIISYCEPGDLTYSVRIRLITDLVQMLKLLIKKKMGRDDNSDLANELTFILNKYSASNNFNR